MTHDTEFTSEADGVPADAGPESQVATVDVVMTRKVVTVGLDESLHKIRDIFQDEGFHHLLVIEEGELVGVISDRDLLLALSPYLHTLSEQRRDEQTLRRRAHHIMSRHLVTVTRATPVARAAALLLEHRVGCLPVVSSPDAVHPTVRGPLRLITSGRFVEGLVTWRDIMAYYLGFGKP